MKAYSSINSDSSASAGQSFISMVFAWMGLGLALTAFVAYEVYSTSLLAYLVNETGVTGLGYLIMFLPLVFVLIMSFGFNGLSSFALAILFILYAAIMGASLSFIFLIYSNESIYSTFIVAALMFGLMAAIGFLTKTDLTKMGSVLLMALFGIIIASLINIFMKNDALTSVISFISVIVFSGLTAWDMQKLKTLASDASSDPEIKSKFGILGALTLYLDFINLFLSLLRFFGRRKK